MLKALLHRKLGRAGAGDQGGGSEECSNEEGFTGREDPLTSVIFERITYLGPTEAWRLLRAACVSATGDRFPEPPFPGKPEWSFWPHLLPGDGGQNTRRVEPDVLVEWGDVVLVIEAKHAGTQGSWQWVEQIRAVRAGERFHGKRILFIAAGGADLATFAALVKDAKQQIADAALGFWLMRWAALHDAVERRRLEITEPGVAAILSDMSAALDAWGYRRRFWLDTLPEEARRWRTTTTAPILDGWRLK